MRCSIACLDKLDGGVTRPARLHDAGGEPGPHFFIYLGQGPAKSWGLSHTVWGLLADKDSFEVAEKLVGLPAKAKDPRGWPIMLLKPEPFTMTLHKLPGSQR